MTDDGELLRLYVQDGSQVAFTQLVERYMGLVYSCALRRTGGNTAQAADIAQAVFVALARKGRYLGGHPTLAGWLHRTAYFTATTILRNERRRKQREQESQAMSETDKPRFTPAEWEAIRPVIDQALLKLGDLDREVVILRFLESRSFAEIGRRLGMSEAAAQKRASRAIERVRRFLPHGRSLTSVVAFSGLLASRTSAAVPMGLVHSVSAGALGASVPVGAISVLLFRFMSATKMTAATASFVGLAALVGVVSSAAGYYQLRQAKQERAALVGVAQRIERDETAAKQLGKAVAGLDPSGNVVPGRPDETNFGQSHTWMEFEAANPEARKLLVSAMRVRFNAQYKLFFELEGLSADQHRAIEDKAVASWVKQTEEDPLDARAEAIGDTDGLRGIIGDKALAALNDYPRMINAAAAISHMDVSAGYAGVPISATQEVQVAKIMAANSPEYQAGKAIVLNAIDWETANQQIQAVVTPDQWKALLPSLATNRLAEAVARASAADAAGNP